MTAFENVVLLIPCFSHKCIPLASGMAQMLSNVTKGALG